MKSTRYPDRVRTDLTDTVITINGVGYLLTVDAYKTNYANEAVYEATAIRTDEHPDEDGYQQMYLIRWSILEGWDGSDESDACDWEYPDIITEYDLALME